MTRCVVVVVVLVERAGLAQNRRVIKLVVLRLCLRVALEKTSLPMGTITLVRSSMEWIILCLTEEKSLEE